MNMYNTACDVETLSRPLRVVCRRSFRLTKIRLNTVQLTINMKASSDYIVLVLSLNTIVLNLSLIHI